MAKKDEKEKTFSKEAEIKTMQSDIARLRGIGISEIPERGEKIQERQVQEEKPEKKLKKELEGVSILSEEEKEGVGFCGQRYYAKC